MRVTIAALVCLFALLRGGADPAFARAADLDAEVSSAESAARASFAFECSEPSRVAERSGLVGPADTTPVEDVGVLWCVTPDDPRCAPIESGSRSILSFLREPLACALGCEIEPAIARSAAGPAPAERMDDVRDGVGLRVERPPRA
jgi:hypothetical protein